jgi:activating signal cointegrator 1
MQAISLWQPWASLMAHGLKRIETRSWRYRGKLPAVLAIHATAKVDEKLVAQLINDRQTGAEFRRALTMMGCPVHEFQRTGLYACTGGLLPAGAVVAIGRLVECVTTTVLIGPDLLGIPCLARKLLTDQERAFGDYSVGRYAWVFDRIERLDPPVPAKGNRMVWTWDAPAEVQALAEKVGAA